MKKRKEKKNYISILSENLFKKKKIKPIHILASDLTIWANKSSILKAIWLWDTIFNFWETSRNFQIRTTSHANCSDWCYQNSSHSEFSNKFERLVINSNPMLMLLLSCTSRTANYYHLLSKSSHRAFLFLIGKLHMHPVGLEPKTSPSFPLLWEKEVQVELYLIGHGISNNKQTIKFK